MNKKENKLKILTAGIIKENPIFVMFLGMCPTLATTSSLNSALGMSGAFIIVLILSNILISAVRKIVPNQIRIPVYIVIIATIVKVIEMLMNAYAVSLYDTLGVFLALIVVNCIILGRAEAFASKNSVFDSTLDALGVGIGFALGLILIATVRELLGTGGLIIINPFNTTHVILDVKLFADYAASILVQPAGAFLTLGTIVGVINTIKIAKAKKVEAK